MNKVVFVKQNNYRKDKFYIVTTIETDYNGKKHVIKTAKNNKSIEFLNSFFEKYEFLNEIYKNSNLSIIKPTRISNTQISFEYLEMENFENILVKELEKKDFKKFKYRVNKFFNTLFQTKATHKNFKHLENYQKYFETFKNIPNGTPLIDINFDNFLYKEGKYYLIDYEWTFDTNFNSEFLKNRTLFYFLKRNKDFFEPKLISDQFSLTKETFKSILEFESVFIENLTINGNSQFERLISELKNMFSNKQTSQGSILLLESKINEYIDNLRETCTQQEAEIAGLEININEIKQANFSRDKELKEIKESFSWKLTNPFRVIFKFIKNILNIN